MAILKQTYVSGNLYVTESNSYVSASEFRGMLVGTASYANEALTASHALNIAPNADLKVNSLEVAGDAYVSGNLQVMGDLTYVGVKDLRVKDHTIEINADESGSAVAPANGAGVVIKNSAAEGDITMLYSSADDKLHVNKTIAGTVDSASEAAHAVSASRADSAESADKVKFALTFGAGISKSVASYDGHEAVVIDVNTTEMEKVVVSNSLQAVSASIADKVAEDLTITVKHSGSSDVVTTYNGSAEQAVNVDFTAVENDIVEHSASIAQLRADVEAMSGGSGSISTQIQNAINELNATASVTATGTPANDGVFVLQGVSLSEAKGKLLEYGSATSVEVERAGAAAAAKAELLGADTDATSSMTLHGIKNYVDAKTGDGVTALSSSVATDIANVMASQSAASQSISQSIAAVDAKADLALNEVEGSDWVAVSTKANQKQTISAKTQAVAGADATSANGLALAADVKSYVDSQVSSKNVSAEGDDWVAASAANNKVTVATNIKAIASATAADDGLAKASDIKDYVSSSVSSSVAALSSSVAATDAAQDARLDALETASGSAITRLNTIEVVAASYAIKADVDASESADRARLDALETAGYSAITRLDALEIASATHVTSASLATIVENQAKVDATQSARLDALESSSAKLDDLYVKKAGDAMTGALTASADGIVFGDMKIVWNAQAGAIEFVANE